MELDEQHRVRSLRRSRIRRATPAEAAQGRRAALLGSDPRRTLLVFRAIDLAEQAQGTARRKRAAMPRRRQSRAQRRAPQAEGQSREGPRRAGTPAPRGPRRGAGAAGSPAARAARASPSGTAAAELPVAPPRGHRERKGQERRGRGGHDTMERSAERTVRGWTHSTGCISLTTGMQVLRRRRHRRRRGRPWSACGRRASSTPRAAIAAAPPIRRALEDGAAGNSGPLTPKTAALSAPISTCCAETLSYSPFSQAEGGCSHRHGHRHRRA